MNKHDVEEQVRQILSEQLEMSMDNITRDSVLREELNMNSFSSLEILYSINETFNVEIPVDEVPRIKTVQDLTDYILSRAGINK